MPSVSLAKQLAELNKPAPADFDPEDVQLASTQNDDDADVDIDADAGREHYFEVGPSSLRKSRDNVTDPKYDGVRISRNQLLDDENLSENNPSDEDPPEESSDEDNEQESELHDDPPPKASDVPKPIPPSPTPQEEDLSSSLKRVREQERKKGKAVACQQATYDTLIDARIRLQKCLTSVNRLPNASDLPFCLVAPTSRSAADNVLREAMALADDLFDLQEKIMKVNNFPDAPARKRRRVSGPEDDRDWDEELLEKTTYFSELESTLHPHILSTLHKWSNKVLAVDPSALLPSSRNKFSRSSDGPKSAVQLIDDALLDHAKLLARTQEWSGKDPRLAVRPINAPPGASNADAVGDTPTPAERRQGGIVDDVFDDTDFYQQLLRDVIDSRRGGGGADAAGADDWRLAQRQRKPKKVVDTRASKGRKLRFEVHEKLQNFMAPIPAPTGAAIAWHEAQIDELFASLLGRGYSDNAADIVPAVDTRQPALDDGFKIFG